MYWADVTKSCKTSRCVATGLLLQFSMRQERIRANRDMAGESNFIYQQDRKIIAQPGHVNNLSALIQNPCRGINGVPAHLLPIHRVYLAGIFFRQLKDKPGRK